MVKEKYIPSRGDIVWINLDPQQGKEQRGHRPALIVSSKVYNKNGLALICPITSKQKNYPYAVQFESGKVSGSILADHVKSQDWKTRKTKFITRINAKDLKRVQKILLTMMLYRK